MKFVKIRIKDIKKEVTIQWQMVIDNMEDLNKYHHLDATLNAQALIALPKTKAMQHIDNPRMAAIDTMLEIASYSEEKKYPIIEVARLTDMKYAAMVSFMRTRGALRVAMGGGFCGLQDYLKTWNGEILETIEKDDLGFPVDDKVVKCDTLVLENSFYRDELGEYTRKEIQKAVGDNVGVIGFIHGLTAVDISYVFKAIMNAKNVYISSQLLDDQQLDGFMELFTKVPRKNIYLDMYAKTIAKLKAHKLFETNNNIHKIIFVKD